MRGLLKEVKLNTYKGHDLLLISVSNLVALTALITYRFLMQICDFRAPSDI